MLVDIAEARALGMGATHALGYDDASSAAIVDHLIDAGMRGYDKFGLPRIIAITELLQREGMPDRPATVVRETPLSAYVDGAGQVGYVVAHTATKVAVDKALETGVGIVGATNTLFTGLLSYYCEMATSKGLIAICSSSASPNVAPVAPYGASEPRLGTNPIAIAIPGPNHPVIWDIGTSAMLQGDLWLKARRGEQVDPGLAIDSEGNETVDAAAATKGAIRAWGGHRGTGLSTMVQLLGGFAGPGGITESGLPDFGFLLIALNPEKLALSTPEELAEAVGSFAGYYKSARPAADDAQELRLPFERSNQQREENRRRGTIWLDDDVKKYLQLITKHGIGAELDGE